MIKRGIITEEKLTPGGFEKASAPEEVFNRLVGETSSVELRSFERAGR